MIFLGVIAVLLFGEQLPEVARTFGKKFADFRKNIQSIQDEIRSAATAATSEFSSAFDVNSPSAQTASSSSTGVSTRKRRSPSSDQDYEEATAPKFVPPPPSAEDS